MAATRRSRWLHVDAGQGASGDMILGALVDLGVGVATLRRALETLPLDGWSIRARSIVRCGLKLRKVDVRVRGHEHGRGWKEIRRIVERAKLSPEVRSRALRVFRRLIEAEAEVHGVAPDKVHLHEAGATDALVDVVGACIGLEQLAIERILVSPLTTGFGQVRCDHGVYPVPAPATALLVRGVPVCGGDLEGERLTPTGAALLTTLADGWGPLPAMRPVAIGYGAGERDFGAVPNALRMIVGEPEPGTIPASDLPEVAVIECTLDDSTPQAVAHGAERLLAAGALDVFTTSVTMKKGRVGHNLTVLGRPGDVPELTAALLRETSTLGVRIRTERRVELARRVERVKTDFGVVRMKLGLRAGSVVRAWPEYEDCAVLAARRGVSLWDVQRAAVAAHAELRPKRRRK